MEATRESFGTQTPSESTARSVPSDGRRPPAHRSAHAVSLIPRPVHVIAVGGTIACTKRHGADVPTLSGRDLLERAGLPWKEIPTTDSMRLDSAELTPRRVAKLAAIVREVHRRSPDSGFVITMGTDTIVETACVLQRLLSDLACTVPIVVTGSMRTSEHRDWDGASNLRDSVNMASLGYPCTSIVFGGSVMEPSLAVKVSPVDPEGILPTGQGELGIRTTDGKLSLNRYVRHQQHERASFTLRFNAIVRFVLHQGATAAQLKGLLSVQPQVCVIEAFGDTNFPVAGKRGAALLRAIEQEISARGTLFVAVSQCPFGHTDCAYPGGQKLRDCGVLPGTHIAGFAAAAARAAVVVAMVDTPDERRHLWNSVVPGDVRIEEIGSALAGAPALSLCT